MEVQQAILSLEVSLKGQIIQLPEVFKHEQSLSN